MSGVIDWIVFAEDWGRHPSTTQHLIAHLPVTDRVLWVNSIGMRAPQLRREDLLRIVEKLGGLRARPTEDAKGSGRAPNWIARPLVLPWHERASAVAINRRLLSGVRNQARRMGLVRPVLVTANPAVVNYLDGFDASQLIYLRLDNFATMPGVDASLVHASEGALHARADLIVAPSRRLVPPGMSDEKARVLPQGVDVAAFDGVPLTPPKTNVLGYWGVFGEWMDFDLVVAVAKALPGWRFEFRGAPRAVPAVASGIERLRRVENIDILEPVPHHRLAAVSAHWSAAWAPFTSGDHLSYASPLKLREYLAAGFPCASTPLPEADEIGDIESLNDSAEMVSWLTQRVPLDSAEARARRRAAMASESWGERTRVLRDWVARGNVR